MGHIPSLTFIGEGTLDERYPVVYLNDGQAWLRGVWSGPQLECDVAHDRLVEDGLIRPAILVAINFNREGRVRDLTPAAASDGNVERYYKFLADRLKPYIDGHFRTLPEPVSTAIVGISLGGLAAFLLAYYHPETFGLAGCMSPSFWYGDRCMIQTLLSEGGNKKEIRFWLDAGGSEYVAWTDIVSVYSVLEQQGWRPGDELAAHLDYTGAHVMGAWRHRMRDMLYFLLRKEPLQCVDYHLVPAIDPTATVFDLRKGHRRIIGAEAWYANHLRLNVPQPHIVVDDSAVVTLNENDPILLDAKAAGETTIRSTYLGFEAVLKVIGSDVSGSDDYLPCRRADTAPVQDGVRADWFDLPHEIINEARNTIGRLGLLYDDYHVHIAIDIRDSFLVSDPATSPRNQDSVWVCFDARPEPTLWRGEGYDNTERFLNIVVSPSKAGDPINLCSTDKALDWLPFLPEDTQTVCALVPDGYQMTLSIPLRYIEEIQGGPWQVFRLNICVNNIDRPGEPITRTWWHPEWHCPIAAGIFKHI